MQAPRRLTQEDQSFINVPRCGRGYDKLKRSTIDDHIGKGCDDCGAQLCDFDHITWRCQHFAPQRAEACKALADLDPDALHPSIRRGIAPALAAIPNATFWGQTKINGNDFTTAQAATLKNYEELPQPIPPKTRPARTDDCLTDEERTVLKNISNNYTLNARQVIEKIKDAYEISPEIVFHHISVNDLPPTQPNCYTDGGVDFPTIRWGSLPGVGVWWPDVCVNRGPSAPFDEQTRRA